jgi:hypothetical protein
VTSNKRRLAICTLLVAPAAAAGLTSAGARADEGVRGEPHFSLGAAKVYGAPSFGARLRICYLARECRANYLVLPTSLEWDPHVVRPVSVLREGAFVYKGWFDGCAPSDGPGCSPLSTFWIVPTLALGARIPLGRDVALTLRLGYPTWTLYLTFL